MHVRRAGTIVVSFDLGLLLAERIDLVPDGFDGWAPAPRGSDDLRQRLGITARHVLGYIGSFNAYECLEECQSANWSPRSSPSKPPLTTSAC